ncbi:ATP-dependent DNA helicase srs2 [Fulvia fulva]|uniref:DNA 3'-5' helicase n=1 Tax=Passalora fulva TaxID=5499 RepID=A0A9Q8P4H7_PASFU|nr:ATP-dependent DNA helicase srs2 [Fulvia fulva]KAK4636297.1 ATP-dependent DNA helicase srs2 [Fulvia fulva]KAK4638351.1 ATP-dependent DNA helicase srs2 [Fulvia fulva]UJO12988.1 ATP-dependent DNA helicase srs2 [Fulvia fulva]WPV08785.1 ATP-dependent DNA helicase srs2 [Fulvia fulva]WPV23276.1 ATP-dependent DNA helicase srs2 [Fulvia fulva]
MDNIWQGLNEAQKTAVASDAAVLQVLAPPGSGKTKTLTARVAYLVAHRQWRPCNIIVCTFTVKAAAEMKERIKNFVGEELSKQLQLGTFHSVALRYLKRYGQHIGLAKDFGIADSADSKAILKRLIKKLGLSMEPGSAFGRISSRKVRSDDDPKSGKGPAKKGVEQQEFQRLFDDYEATLAASNLLDYDDILLRCHFLVKSHPQCVSDVEAVLIDEFQDTNNIQYDLMTLFAQQRNVITIVGDPDQSIYGFRAAEIKNLSRMKKHWPDTLTIHLEENYRSSGAILLAAQNVIEQDESRPPKKLQATHSYGLRPVLRKLPSAFSEAEWLVSEIKRMQALSGGMMQSSDFAVLLRSAALSRAIETAFGNAGIPYRMVGGMRFYDRAEVKLLVDYLRVIHNPHNTEAVERIVNVPSRKVGDETIKRLREEATSKGISLWSLVLDVAQGRCSPKTKLNEPARKGLGSFVNVILCGHKKVESWKPEEASIVDLISMITQKISLQAYLKQKHADDETHEARWNNVEELMAQAADVMAPGKLAELGEADSLPNVDDLEQRSDSTQDALSIFLSNIALTASAEKKADEDGEQVQQVTISTIHASKGLEWPVVFIPACYDGSIPHSRADDHDEERRLLYVGMTRAQALLYLSCPIKNTQREETSMSTFLTHKGVGKFFEEHGPSLPFDVITSLSSTLRRECPSATLITESKRNSERDEDNYWPLNGEEAMEETRRWDYSKKTGTLPGFGSAKAATWASDTTMQRQETFSIPNAPLQTGFTSVKERYDELVEQGKMDRSDKRAEEKKDNPMETKGRKRQIEGQGSISSFFKKPKEAAEVVEQPQPARPLREIPNAANHGVSRTISTSRQSVPDRKPRATPMSSRPQPRASDDANNGRYVFLSSSPQKGDDEQEQPFNTTGEKQHESQPAASTSFRPASTFHTTSMATASGTQRRTLGVRRSLHGWSERRKP